MSSTTRMLVLGIVRTHQPVHGWDVRKELISWHAEDWGNVARGSIYGALKTLAKEGMIEEVGTHQVGGRPERTTYRITPRGEEELSALLHQTLWDWKMPTDPLLAALSMMPYLEREDLIAALEHRVLKIKAALFTDRAIDTIADTDTPQHVREMLRLINARVAAEIPWSAALVERLKKGEYTTAGEGEAPTKATPKGLKKPTKKKVSRK